MVKLAATFIAMSEEPFLAWLSSSILMRAHERGLLSIRVESILKSVGFDHHAIDDALYGGGPGELMRIDVVEPLIEKTLLLSPAIDRKDKRVILMDPQGELFHQTHARRLSSYRELIFISGRYEGIDARINHYVDESISLGDFVLSSGDLAAMAMLDATARMIPGVIGNNESIVGESHYCGRLEPSHFTRPKDYHGHSVPAFLLSGHHREIERLRRRESLQKTMRLRPDLIREYPLNSEEIEALAMDDRSEPIDGKGPHE